MARQARSCQKRWTTAPRAVQALHKPTPKAITARRERRSPMTPSGNAASDSTTTYAEPSQPNCTSDSASSRLTCSNNAKMTLRSM